MAAARLVAALLLILSACRADECVDTDGEAAYNGYTGDYSCDDFVASWCGGSYDDDDFTSDDMCCVCGGGSSTPTPTAAPTARPTAVPTSGPTAPPTAPPTALPTPECTDTDGDVAETYCAGGASSGSAEQVGEGEGHGSSLSC